MRESDPALDATLGADEETPIGALRIGSTVGGRYRIQRFLGAGGILNDPEDDARDSAVVAVEDGLVIERFRGCGGGDRRVCLGAHNRITTPEEAL